MNSDQVAFLDFNYLLYLMTVSIKRVDGGQMVSLASLSPVIVPIN